MDIKDYLKRADAIRASELMTHTELAKKMNITYVTFMRLHTSTEKASMQTLRKLKVFVEAWEYKIKNMSVPD